MHRMISFTMAQENLSKEELIVLNQPFNLGDE
jgi:hypothetical protein